jgi:hypothetical protein
MPAGPARPAGEDEEASFEVSPNWAGCPLPVKHDDDIAPGRVALPADQMFGLQPGTVVVLRRVGTKPPYEFEVESTDLPDALRVSKDDFDRLGLSDRANTVEIRLLRSVPDKARKLADTSVVGYGLGIVVAVLAFVAATWFPAPEKGADTATVRSATDDLVDELDIDDPLAVLDDAAASLDTAARQAVTTTAVDPDAGGPLPVTEVVDARDVAAVQEEVATIADDVSDARDAIDDDVATARDEVDELTAAVTDAEREADDDGRRHDRFQLIQQAVAVLVAVVLAVLAIRGALRSRLGA